MDKIFWHQKVRGEIMRKLRSIEKIPVVFWRKPILKNKGLFRAKVSHQLLDL